MLQHQWPCIKKTLIFFLSFFFRHAINLCMFCQKHTLTHYWSWWRGQEKMPILFLLLRLQTSCSFGTFPKAAHPVMIGANHCYCKIKFRAYNDKVPWGCRRFQSWKGSATRIPCWADPGLRQVLPMGIELLILRPGLVNQSQEHNWIHYLNDARW